MSPSLAASKWKSTKPFAASVLSWGGMRGASHPFAFSSNIQKAELVRKAELYECSENSPVAWPDERSPAGRRPVFGRPQRIVDRIAELDLDGLTPREALNLLAELQRELGALA